MSNNVFIMKNLTKDRENQIRISGDLILNGRETQVTVEVSESKPGSTQPKIKYPIEIPPLGPGDLKWILPPERSPIYEETKSRVQLMGFQIIAHEDYRP